MSEDSCWPRGTLWYAPAMNLATTIEIATRLSVLGSITPKGLIAVLAVESQKLQQRAAAQGRHHGEVEIDRDDCGVYHLIWKDEHPVSDEPTSKNTSPHFINNPSGMSKGSGFYGSRETINGVDVRLERDCSTHHLVAAEVHQVMEYRLKCVLEQLASFGPNDDDPVAVGLEAVKEEYEWFLKLLKAPQHT